MLSFRRRIIRRFSSRYIRLGWLAALVLAAASLHPSLAHEGHDHGEDARAAPVASTFPRVATRSELYEIVGILKDGRLAIFVDDAATNEPVPDASLQVTVGDASPIDAEQTAPGVYRIAMPSIALKGAVEVIFAIKSAKGEDLLVDSFAPSTEPATQARPANYQLPVPLQSPIVPFSIAGGLVLAFLWLRSRQRRVAALSAAAAAVGFLVLAIASLVGHQGFAAVGPSNVPAALSDAPRRLPDGTVFAAKPTQRLLDVRTVAAEPQTVQPATNLMGRVIGDPNRTSIVQSIYGGRVVPIDGKLPRLGQQVIKGEALIEIEPHLPVADRTTISEKSGEIEQLIAMAETRIRRLRPLAERGAVPQSQVSDLEIELEGLRVRREAVRNSRSDREVLLAPTDGIITAAKVTPGQVIQPQDVLIQIADPKGLWVEALAYGDGRLNPAAAATASTANGQTLPLSYVGLSRELRQHASVVHFSISEPPPGLSIGQPVTVLLQSGASTEGLVLPRDAIVRSTNGEAIGWLHVAPERFEPRPMRTLPLDSGRVIVAAGLNANERVVVRGADLVNQIR
jgi:biotin carboxyl carrier protein